MIDNKQVYVPIQDLRPGILVKTYKHGYKEVELIGKNQLINDPHLWYSCMYKHNKTGLMITGLHSILVDTYSFTEFDKQKCLWGSDFMHNPKCKLEDKYLILSVISDSFTKMDDTNTYIYYHLCLKSDDLDRNYGIWADKTLTETMSINEFLKHKFIILK